jgi:predicted small metal-binding protein
MAHQYGCSECSFLIRSDDEDEVIDVVRTHADESHDMRVSRADVEAGIETVAAEADD